MEKRKSHASIRPKPCTNLMHRNVPVIFSTTKTYQEILKCIFPDVLIIQHAIVLAVALISSVDRYSKRSSLFWLIDRNCCQAFPKELGSLWKLVFVGYLHLLVVLYELDSSTCAYGSNPILHLLLWYVEYSGSP